jgi:two-component system, NarL family, response regulator NreC
MTGDSMQIKVWLADDHAMFRSGLRALLEKEDGIEVVGETGTGHDTLAALKTSKVDILLLDINMPGLSGMRVTELALKDRPRLLIVVLTMHEDEYYLQELFKLGVRGYVLKKSTGTEVVQAIRAVYRGDSYIDPAMASLVLQPYVGKTSTKKNSRLDLLTRREQEVLDLLVHGFTNLEIAEKLSISDRTVETHRANINSKLELKSRADLVRFSLDNGLLKAS